MINMSKFQIGDKVKLRDDLEVRRRYGKLEFLSGMRNLEGKELTIDLYLKKVIMDLKKVVMYAQKRC